MTFIHCVKTMQYRIPLIDSSL